MSRPRSEKSHHKVLEAAVRLFSEQGIDATSMDAIAAQSGVSKATIYKHWPDKDALALEVLVWLYRLDEEPHLIEPKTLREDLVAALSYRPVEHHMRERERIMPHLIAYSARNQVFGKAWRSKVVVRHTKYLAQVLQAAIDRGELHPDLSIDVAVALLFGPMMYRQMFVAGSRDEKAPPAFIAQVVDAFVRAFAQTPDVLAADAQLRSHLRRRAQ
ncbi:MAG TPA: TetR/AcrR family transcriptional regulator [Candidatus Aquilonibacter sp.]|nr:TetR/AcrR family transcriptional regulator [Candidatus Aquilonibacter sp.]